MKPKKCDDSDFEQVFPGISDETSCSPKLGDDFLGIQINAPEEVRITDPKERELRTDEVPFAKIMVCGTYKIKDRDQWDYFPIDENLKITAVNTLTNEKFVSDLKHLTEKSYKMDTADEVRRERPTKFSKTLRITSWFNPNIHRMLPDEVAEYEIHATLGSYTSNKTRIKVLEHTHS